jgi:hypothetical protein
MLAILRDRSYPEPFVEVSKLPTDAQLKLELDWLQTSLTYARNHLGL